MTYPADRLADRIQAIDAAAAETTARTEAFRAMTGELAAVESTERTPDGLVTVTASADGTVTGLVYGAKASTTPPDVLAQATLRAIGQARAAAAKDQSSVVRRYLGDAVALDAVLADDERVFGDRRPVVARRAPARRDDATFEDKTFLEDDLDLDVPRW